MSRRSAPLPLFHLTWSATARRSLCPTPEALRAGVRALDRVVGAEALFFCVVDDHVHVVARAEARRAGYMGSAFRRAVRALAPDRPLEAAHVRPVEGRNHLLHLLRTYLPSQPAKHGLATHPALYEGSAFLDLAGARALDRFSGRLLAEELPRFRLRELFPVVGLEPVALEPLGPGRLPTLGIGRLVEASPCALASSGEGSLPHAIATRRAAAALAVRGGLRLGDLATCSGIGIRSMQRDATREPVERHLRAVLTRFALEERCRETPLLASDGPRAPYGVEGCHAPLGQPENAA